MPKIKCKWVSCKYNNATEVGCTGECQAEEIELESLEIRELGELSRIIANQIGVECQLMMCRMFEVQVGKVLSFRHDSDIRIVIGNGGGTIITDRDREVK